ncbi:MAG: winged helix-turn-helix domain-containing protein [Actinomycetota bacterium]
MKALGPPDVRDGHREDTLVLGSSGTPTVVLVGERALPTAAEFLRLGAVVVIAPDKDTLRAWQQEHEGCGSGDGNATSATRDERLDVDLRSHRIRWRGASLELTELEFRVLAALAIEPGRAWSFRDLRAAGWDPAAPTADDLHTVRSVVQRLRRKLEAAGALVCIEAIRGFGYRIELRPAPPRSVPDLRHPELLTS